MALSSRTPCIARLPFDRYTPLENFDEPEEQDEYGDHTDEASAVLDSEKEGAEQIAAKSGSSSTSTKRRSKSKSKSRRKRKPLKGRLLRGKATDKDKEEEIQKAQVQNALMHLVRWVTGQYGPPSEDDSWRKTPIIMPHVKNPRRGGLWITIPFFDRMRGLLERLERLASGEKIGPDKIMSPDYVRVFREKLIPAVRFILDREADAKAGRTVSILVESGKGKDGRTLLLPFGLKWSIVKADGNSKLPFAAYSEAAMATCSGAGLCAFYPEGDYPGVSKDGQAVLQHLKMGKGYCYSLKAWRYPHAFARQVLNALAATADREFAIYAVSGGADVTLDREQERANLGMEGMHHRVWQEYVRREVIDKTVASWGLGKIGFMRLFVDGDINTSDTVHAWMCAIARLGADDPDLLMAFEAAKQDGTVKRLVDKLNRKATGERGEWLTTKQEDEITAPGYVEVYGYTKCWKQFVELDDYYREVGAKWPSNYAVNLSGDSVYATHNAYRVSSQPDVRSGEERLEIRRRMEALPVYRGYFMPINFARYSQALESIYDPRTNTFSTKSVYDRATRSLAVFQPGAAGTFFPDPQKALPKSLLDQMAEINHLIQLPDSVRHEATSSLNPKTTKKQVLNRDFFRRLALISPVLDEAQKILTRLGGGALHIPVELPSKPGALPKMTMSKEELAVFRKLPKEQRDKIIADRRIVEAEVRATKKAEESRVKQIRQQHQSQQKALKQQKVLYKSRWVSAHPEVGPETYSRNLFQVISAVREQLYRALISESMKNQHFSEVFKRELRRDAAVDSEDEHIRKLTTAQKAKVKDWVAAGKFSTFDEGAKAELYFSNRAEEKKVALLLQEFLVATTESGSSCPLACGNCSDRQDPTDPSGLHRCASKDVYRGATIWIGLH